MIFEGVVTFGLIDNIVSVLSGRLEEIETSVTIRKKVFGVLLECLQNLGSHVEKLPADNFQHHDAVLFSIDVTADEYRIVTGNYIENAKVESLKKWLDQIKSFSASELKTKYNQVLMDCSFSSKGGGGLGFLDIALRVNGNIDYLFEPVNDLISFFSFQATIKK